jgi:hypothetical protein
MVRALLASRSNKAENFFSEIRDIIGKEGISKIVPIFATKYRQGPEVGTAPISYNIVEVYEKANLYNKEQPKPVIKLSQEQVHAEKFEAAVKATNQARSKLNVIVSLMRRYNALKSAEAHGEIRVILLQTVNNFVKVLHDAMDYKRYIEEVLRWDSFIPISSNIGGATLSEVGKIMIRLLEKTSKIDMPTKTLKKDADASVTAIIKTSLMDLESISGVKLISHK